MSDFPLPAGNEFSTSNVIHKPLNNSRNYVGKNSVVLVQEGAEVKSIPAASDSQRSISQDGVHISPSFIEFTEASEGITCQQRITIKNIGSKPAFVKIREPNSIAFQVKVLKNGIMLNPGLSVSTRVTYTFKRPSFLRAMIPIEINGKVLDYRVICTLTTERISIDPKLIDFGTIDVGYSSGIKVITITNEGGKSTRFSVDLGKNDLEVTVKPLKGIVKANKEMKLTVELIGMNEGLFYSEFWIKSVPNIRVRMKVNVIVPRLIVHHPNTTGDFTLIDFPPTAENSIKFQTFVLRNLSSQASSYIVLAEIDNEVKCIRDITIKEHPLYDTFEIRPLQGRMDPFESIIFEVVFSPKSKWMQLMQRTRRKRLKEKRVSCNDTENDFMAFIRIIRVHCTETKDIPRIDTVKDFATPDDASQRKIMQDTAILDSSTSSSSEASSTDPGVDDTVRLCLYGEVEIARLNFEPDTLYCGELYVGEVCQKVICIRNPLKSISLTFRFVRNIAAHCFPKAAKLNPNGAKEVLVKVKGKENVQSPFDLLFDLLVESYDSSVKRNPIKVKVRSYSVKCFVNILLKSKKTAGERCLYEMKSMLKKPSSDNYLINTNNDALPVYPKSNRTPTSSRNHKDVSIKAIHKNNRKELNVESDEDICVENIMKLPISKRKEIWKIACCHFPAVGKRLASKAKDELLIPLSPLQIYNVHIFPTIFTFGMVALKACNYRQLIAENKNDFPVMIRLVSLSRCINFPEGNLAVLSANSLISRLIEFRAIHIGKFNGYIDYEINDNHSFELSITADVVHKQISLDKREIEFGKDWFPEEVYQPPEAIIQIRNKLDAKTSFKWEMHSSSGFFVEPSSGTIRGNNILYSYVHYDPDISESNYTEMIIKCETRSYITVKLNLPLNAAKVSFVNDNIDVGEIPLNLSTRVNAVLRNFEHRAVLYEVDATSLIRGCDVHPLRGKIPPRGVAILELQIKIDACVRFSMTIRVTVQKCQHLDLRISGKVSFPRLKLFPALIDSKRISVDAYQCHLITATNIGTTNLKLNFDFQEYEEFRISLSSNKIHAGIGQDGIIIAPGINQDLYLHFQPIDLASYAFYLPIRINDIFGPALITDSKTLDASEYTNWREEYYLSLPGFIVEELNAKLPIISIDCTVAGHVIQFNKLLFHFDVRKSEVQDELIMENTTSSEKTVLLDTLNFVDSEFLISWSRGSKPNVTSDHIECKLEPKEESVFIIEFKPETHGKFDIEIPILLRGEEDNILFNKLNLEGECSGSSIEAETSEIYLTPVPLQRQIEKKFFLKIKHFDKPAIISATILDPVRCSGEYKNDMLSVTFARGNRVTVCPYGEMELTVMFKSNDPISLCTVIKFHDETQQITCPVTIYAIADNSLLTTHAFFKRTSSETRKGRYMEHHISSFSIPSGSETDDEDYDESLQTAFHKTGRTSGPKVTFHTHFGRGSMGSIGKMGNGESRSEYIDTDKPKVNEEEDDLKECQLDKNGLEYAIEPYLKHRRMSERVYHPFYPAGFQNGEFDSHMSRTLKAAEEWLYSCPCKFHFYPAIPNGITLSLSGILSKTKRRSSRREKAKNPRGKSQESGWSFFEVFKSLMGPGVQDYFGNTDSLPDNDVERIEHVIGLYKKMLEFLLSEGACVAHISPEFLLNYNDYLVLFDLESAIPERKSSQMEMSKEKLSHRAFQTRSKQCWLDVILQTYKCFVIVRVSKIMDTFRTTSVSGGHRRSTLQNSITISISSLPRQFLLYHKIIQNVSEVINNRDGILKNHTSEEATLLAWLYYHYDYHRVQDWMTDRRVILNPNESRDVARERTVNNFDDDLSDSLVLITVTAAYCPFLIDEHFGNLYISPRNYEEGLHNAICLVNAWRRIRLGFIITPLEIVYPNCIQMIMLVTHLFEVLPTYIPRAKVTFGCPLTESTLRQISFTNPTNFSVGYLIQFVGNDSHFFTIDSPQSILQLNGHENVLLKIRFCARKIKKTRAYLLLCGSAIGPNLGRNQIFLLEGQADNLCVSKQYVIRSKLYQVVENTLEIDVPYRNEAEYEIWLSEDRPTRASSLKMIRWSELRIKKIPRRLFLNQKSIIVEESSKGGQLSITVACIAPIHRSFWLIFQSKLGDFIIQINSIWQAPMSDRIVVEWSDKDIECICSNGGADNNTDCPFNLTVPFPARNSQLWSCVSHMFQKSLNQNEQLFWSRYIDTNIGLRLIRWLMRDMEDPECAHIFDKTIIYDVTISDKSSPLVIPEAFTIDDVRSPNRKSPMTVHILPSTSNLYETTMSLTSSTGKEIRIYTLDFLCV